MTVRANKYTMTAQSGTATITGHIVFGNTGTTKRVSGLTISTGTLLGTALLAQSFVSNAGEQNQVALFNITSITGSGVYVGVRNDASVTEDAGVGNFLLPIGNYESNPIQLGVLPGGA